MRKTPVFSTAEAVEEAFYDALRRGDAVGLMALWAEDEEVVCVHPGSGRLLGFDAIRASFEQILSGGGIDVRCAELRVIQSATIAVHSLIERIAVGDRGIAQVVEVVVTNVYVKDPLGWRMVVHQAGPGGDAGPREPAPPAPGTTLH